MKKVIMFLLLAVIMASMSAVFTSCNSFEDEAIAQMRKTMKELAKNPDTYKITDIDVKFCNDSVCVIHTKEKGQNGMGGWSSSMSEYVYVKTTYKGEVHYMESVLDLSDEDNKGRDVYTCARNMYDSFLRGEYDMRLDSEVSKIAKKTNWKDENPECRAEFISKAALFTAAFNGREINKKENSDKDDWQ